MQKFFLNLVGLMLAIGWFHQSLLAQTESRFNVVEASIGEIHDEVKAGRLTFEQLVESYLNRIEQYDQSSKLNSIILVNPNALEHARELDRQFKETGKLLPLHGIPVVVKDNYDTHDLQTTAGSILLKDTTPPDDAFQIRKLREAGAIVLCKSNMAEWAFSPWFTESSIAGTTRNPYDLNRVPAGSSGGTAAAVAANLGAVGLGTDTGNSIRGPSSHCCLVGIRPTLGLTSRDGIVPLFLRNDIGGPMCRSVEDTARVLQVIAGHDPNDAITQKSIGIQTNYLESLDLDGLDGARIGIFRTLSDTPSSDKEFSAIFAAAVEDLRTMGAEIIDPFEIDGLNQQQLSRAQNRLWINTFRHDIEEYLKSRGDQSPIKNLDDIIKGKQYGRFLTNRLKGAQEAPIPNSLESPYSANVQDDPNRLAVLNQILKAMDEQRIDAFVFPTWNNPPRKIGDLRSPDGNNSFHISPSTGLPSITVPMGMNRAGLPSGLQFVGREFSEAKLLKFAYAYEQATRHRRSPKRFPRLETK